MKKVMLLAVVFGVVLSWSLALATPREYSSGQVVFAPAAYNDQNEDGDFTASAISIKNINVQADQWIRVTSVAFYSPQGEFVKEFLDSPVVLGPLGSMGFMANEESLGIPPYPMRGPRPSWIVQWHMNYNLTTWPQVPFIESSRFLFDHEEGKTEMTDMTYTNGISISGPSRFDIPRAPW